MSHTGLRCSQVSVSTPTPHTSSITVHRARSAAGIIQTKAPSARIVSEKSPKPIRPDSTSTDRNVLCATY